MKKNAIRILSLLIVVITLSAMVFSLEVSAEKWELTDPGSLDDIVLEAELYNGVFTLKLKSGSGRSVNASLGRFAMQKMPWRSTPEAMTIKEVYFAFGFTDLMGMEIMYLEHAEILHIPSSVTSLGGSNPFGMMLKLKTIYFGGTKAQWEKIAAGIDFSRGLREVEIICESDDSERQYDERWEVGMYNASDVTASRVGDTLYLEGRGMMKNYELSSAGLDALAPWVMNKDLKHVVICDGVRNVGDYAFWGNSGIEDVVIAGSVTTIGIEGFYSTNITEVTIPASVTEIRKNAFEGCGNLTTVYLTQNLDRIDDGAFASCPKLNDVCYGGSKYYWDRITIGNGNDALRNATLVCNYVPEPVDGIGGVVSPTLGTEKDPTEKEPGEPTETDPIITADTDPIITVDTDPQSSTGDKKDAEPSGNSTGAIIALSVAVAVLALLVAFLVVLLVRKKKTEI